MFKKSEIDERCQCVAPEDIIKVHGSKRYRLPKGYYGGRYQTSKYFSAQWLELRCQTCGYERETIHVTYWSSDGSRSPIVSAFPKDGDIIRYQEIRNAIIELMDD